VPAKEYRLDIKGERRRFQRLLVTLPLDYTTRRPDSGELIKGQGVLKNFSLGGVYFQCTEPVFLIPGQILTLTIALPLAPLSHQDSSHIRAQAAIVRLESPFPDTGGQGVGASFLKSPAFLYGSNHVNNNG
jgi:hypothetical protein